MIIVDNKKTFLSTLGNLYFHKLEAFSVYQLTRALLQEKKCFENHI